jgi:hypothetical protein
MVHYLNHLAHTGLKRSITESNSQDTRVRKIVKTEGPVDDP